MKKIKTYQKVLFIVAGLIGSYYWIYKGDNRLTIWLHHGLWLPNTTANINFYTYPGVAAHLVNLDDWAKTELEIPKSALPEILSKEEYRYLIKVDTLYGGAVLAHKMSEYLSIPDSIINGPLPVVLELKSSRGDFLRFYAEEKTDSTLYVHLYTDWN